MDYAVSFVTALVLLSIVLVAVIVLRPSITESRAGKILAFLAFFILPAASLWGGVSLHMEYSKSTEFCLSCHEMEPYGASLMVDDEWYLPAVHYQNHLVDPDRACFTCHTQYTFFGDYKAKMAGLRHLYVHYLGEPPATGEIELYQPYSNRECMHCHSGARSFEEMHEDDLEALAANELSCLECHDIVHEVDSLDEAEMWTRNELEGEAGGEEEGEEEGDREGENGD